MANLLLGSVRDTVQPMEKGDEERAREIGARIKARRLELGLKQEELAERAGASKSFVSELEGGRSFASGIIYLNIAKALDLNVHYLLTGDSPSAEEQVDVFQRVPIVSQV